MLSRALVNQIAGDEALVRGLGDAEARVLVEWLVDRVEADARTCAHAPAMIVRSWSRRGRAISRFVLLWCYEQQPGAAAQLAASEQMQWPFPVSQIDPVVLMQRIIDWEDHERRLRTSA